jgi:hypothetical protein
MAHPETTLSYKECEDFQRAVVAAILPKMGIIRNAARKVVFGSAKYCGLGLDHLTTIQNYYGFCTNVIVCAQYFEV